MRFISSLVVSLTTAIVACSTPPQELVNRGDTKTFLVQDSSDIVYRKIVEGARGCYPKLDVVADFFTDNKSGRVSVSVKTDLQIFAVFVIEIRQVEKDTAVQVYFVKGIPEFANAIELWTRGNYTACPGT
jgi:hypothetical protein